MTKAQLIEQLAERRYDSERISEKEYRYGELSDGDKQFYCDKMAELMPLIVAFVASFIAEQCRKDVDAATCAQRWREEMGQ